MLKKPKHFPVYVASYLKHGKINDESSIIAKIDKGSNNIIGSWGNTNIISIDLYELSKDDISEFDLYSQAGNTYEQDTAILIPKDTWIKYVKKANKLIDETNKKGSSIKRIPY